MLMGLLKGEGEADEEGEEEEGEGKGERGHLYRLLALYEGGRESGKEV